jgi:hypothetical protein
MLVKGFESNSYCCFHWEIEKGKKTKYNQASICSTVVEQMPHHPNVEGLSSATSVSTGQ